MIDEIVQRALTEDLHGGDVTTEACIDPDAKAVARAVARAEIVACGGPVISRVLGTPEASGKHKPDT